MIVCFLVWWKWCHIGDSLLQAHSTLCERPEASKDGLCDFSFSCACRCGGLPIGHKTRTHKAQVILLISRTCSKGVQC